MTDYSTRDHETNRESAANRTTAGSTSRRSFLRGVGAGATVAGLGASVPVTGSAQSVDRTLPWLHREGNELRDPEGNRVVLHGVNVVDPKRGRPEWGHMHTEDAIDLSTDPEAGWNARIIRLPMQPQDIGDHGPGSVDAPAFDAAQLESYCETYVDPVVEKCRERGVYVMLDYHRHYPDGPNWDTDAIDTEIRTFWNVVAPMYAEEPHAILELYNEPNEPYPGAGDPTVGVDVTDPESEETWLKWRDVAQDWVDLVRDHSQSQVIVVGNPRWSQFTYWAPEHEFEGENLAYAGHVYAHENMRPLSTYFGEPSTEVPVFMSEYGWEPGQESPYLVGSRDVEGQQFRDLFEEYDTIHTQAWCFDHSWTPNLLEQVYEGQDRSFPVREDWGEWTVDFLADHADADLPEAPTGAGPGEPGPGPDEPASPSGWTTDVGQTTIAMEWEAVSNADHYNVYRDGSTAESGVTSTTYTVENLDPETTYVIGLEAENDAGPSDLVEREVTTAPDDGTEPCPDAEGGSTTVDGQTVCDLNDDGYYRDVTGDGTVGQGDVGEFFSKQHREAWKHPDMFDFSGNGAVTHGDVVDLADYVALD